MWLSYKTIVYKHVPAKFLRIKRNEKLKQKKKKNATDLLFLFHIKHPAAAHKMKGGQLTAVPKPKANNSIRAQAHHQTSRELFFIVSLQFRPEKNPNQKVPETNSWLIKGD